MDINQLRKETSGCADLAHLNNAGASLMPDIVLDTIVNHLRLESQIGGYEAAEKEKERIEGFYISSAALLHCQPSEIAFTNNATDSYNRALSAIPFAPGDIILTTSNDYSSNYIAFLSMMKRMDVRIVKVQDTDSGEVDLEDFNRKMKELHPRLVAVTHIPTNSGLVQPIEEIGTIVNNFESVFLVDACQTLGQFDVNANKLGCDFLSGTMRKWLRGPRGAGLLYVSQKALDQGYEPLFPDMRGADWESEWGYRPAPSARRFEDWEFAYALVLGSKAAIDYALDIGMESIEERNEELRKYTTNQLSKLPQIRLMDRGSQRCNIITFHVQGGDPNYIKSELHKRKINVSITDRYSAVIDFEKKGIDWVVRVSPHYFNTKEEIDTLCVVLGEIL